MFTVLLLSLLLLTSLLPAQTCLPILQDAQRAYNRGQLKQALTILQKAEICDIDNQIIQQRQRLQGRIFAAIDRQRVEAVEAKAEAEVARQEAEQARLRSDSSLAVANKLIDQLYFYEGKFGLTLKNIGTEFNLKYRYGFINQNGDEVIPFQFEEATPFSVEDGFARVKKGGKDYLLDTLGTTYLLANSLADLTLKKEALDLHEAIPDSLPEDIGRFQGLRVLLAYSSYGKRKLKHLPASIGRLANLQIVDLSSNQLKQLPPEVGNLNSITKLDLRSNRLSQLPPEVGNLNSLTELDLSYNRLKQLPPEVGNLNSITELNLNSNQLNQLPPEIGNLNSLNELRLEGNVLSQLP
ncbi:MAG: WG repeat-containing protein, partial [Bacteroidota bacterium]